MIATKNKGKVNDFRVLFNQTPFEVISLADLAEPIADIPETGSTFEENAIIKAEAIAALLQLPVIADDSGLEVDALDGRPGVFSARYAGTEKDDNKNLHKVLEELVGVNDEERSAQFVCALAVAQPGQSTFVRKGTCKGRISNEPRGTNGFGYDPIFQPYGYRETMSELSSDEKNAISHRSRALNKLDEWLKHQIEEKE